MPTHMSSEMRPFSQHVGELRAHYAGFFDPGFGYGAAGEICGAVGVLEVRSGGRHACCGAHAGPTRRRRPHETVNVADGQSICLMECGPRLPPRAPRAP